MTTKPNIPNDTEATPEQPLPKTRKPRKKATTPRRETKTKPRGPSGPLPQMLIPGYREFRSEVARQNAARRKTSGGPSNSRLGIPDGMRREEAEAAWAKARETAQSQMAALKAAGLAGDDGRAEEAMLVTLQIMHSPMNQELRTKAARQILEWTMPKAATKKTVAVGQAEALLDTVSPISEDQS